MGICVWFNYRNTRSISQDEQTGNIVEKRAVLVKSPEHQGETKRKKSEME